MYVLEVTIDGVTKAYKTEDETLLGKTITQVKAKHPDAFTRVYRVDESKAAQGEALDPYDRLGWVFGPTWNEAQAKAVAYKERNKPIIEVGLRELRKLRLTAQGI